MKYWIQLNARLNSSVPVATKHNSIIEKLKNISNEWGIKAEVPLVSLSYGQNSPEVYSLYRKFNGKSIKGNIAYSYRGKDKDHQLSDDVLTVEFDSGKVDCAVLLNDIIYRLIEIFDAYSMEIFPEDLIHQLAETPVKIRSKVNLRNTIEFFNVVSYYDEELIRRALKLKTLELYNVLEGKIGSVEMFNKGVLLKASNQLLDLDGSNVFNEKMKSILKVSLPVGEPFFTLIIIFLLLQ